MKRPQFSLRSLLIATVATGSLLGVLLTCYPYYCAWRDFNQLIRDAQNLDELAVAHHFASYGKPGISVLRRGLKDANSQVRKRACWVAVYLGENGLPLIPGLVRVYLKDASEDVRSSAAEAIAHIVPTTPIGAGHFLKMITEQKPNSDEAITKLLDDVLADPAFKP